MTIFPHLITASGLTQYEAADYLDVRRSSVSNWMLGRRTVPDGIITDLICLINVQNDMADAALELIENHEEAEEIEIGYCTDNHEAQGLGLPCKSAHDAVIRRIIENCPDPRQIKLVPRGSTVGTAKAADEAGH